MARPRQPLHATSFRLTLGGRESVGAFREVSGLSSETEVTEQRNVDAQGRP